MTVNENERKRELVLLYIFIYIIILNHNSTALKKTVIRHPSRSQNGVSEIARIGAENRPNWKAKILIRKEKAVPLQWI